MIKSPERNTSKFGFPRLHSDGNKIVKGKSFVREVMRAKDLLCSSGHQVFFKFETTRHLQEFIRLRKGISHCIIVTTFRSPIALPNAHNISKLPWNFNASLRS